MAVRIESQAEPIPGYRLIERLGGGGFGEVWKAEAPGGLHKAIKFVFGNLETVDADGARAEQELKALARVKSVRHPYILSLEQIIILGGQLIIIMELADRNLWDRFREARASGLPGIPRDELLGYLQEAAEALDLMNNEHDLQHLDIKPQNIFLMHNHVKVADFGLVKDLEGLQASVTGGVTPYYAAPETFEGWVSRYSDQYSLAIVYQELLVGKRPFNANNTRQLIVQHLHAQPDLEPLPARDRPAIAKALAKKPADRHPSCLDLVKSLRKGDKRTQEIDPEELRRYLAEIDQQTIPAKRGGLLDRSAVAAPPTPGATPALAPPSPEPAPDSDKTPARPEQQGEGLLFPSVVIGLGQLGAEVLAELRLNLLSRYGSMAALPQLRLLYIDTDAETLDLAVKQQLLGFEETLAAKLSNRPSHYLRLRDTLPPVEEWLDPKMVYRIPREMTTAGVRALGRLALVDNYRTIEARLRYELERVNDVEALSRAARQTTLGLRSNWPQVFIVTSFTGGSGSGTFLDIAYNLRSLLIEMGYPRADIVGIFLLPIVEDNPAKALTLANVYSALLELNHFTVSGEGFKARYDPQGPPFTATGAPFQRGVFVPLPLEPDTQGIVEFIRSTAGFLETELLSPVGAEAAKARTRSKEPATWTCFGLYKLQSPRRALVQRVAERVARRVLDQWLEKFLSEAAAAVREEMAAFFQEQKLDTQSILTQLQTAVTKELDQPLEQVVGAWLEPIKKLAPNLPTSMAIREYQQQLDQLLGTSQEMAASWRPPRVPTAVQQVADRVLNQAWQALTQTINQYLDKPGYRQGGAEEAVRQATAWIEEWLKPLEQQAEQVSARLRESSERIQLAMNECDKPLNASKLTKAQRAALGTSIPDQLMRHPILRYQQILAQALVRIYFSLRGRLSDKMRELGYCRQRLRELHQAFKPPDTDVLPSAEPADSEHRVALLPPGCRSLEEAVDQTVQALAPEQFKQVDEALRAALQAGFPSLATLCTTPGQEVMERLRKIIGRAIEDYLESQTAREDVAQLFLGQKDIDAPASIAQMLEEARPGFGDAASHDKKETILLSVPDSPSGQRFLQIAKEVQPAVKGVVGRDPDEIVVFREIVGLRLAALDQLGPTAKHAYDMARSREHFTPHTRLDIMDWKVPE